MTDNSSDEPPGVPWESTCDRFIAFMDVMGFKEWMRREGHETVVGEMRKFVGIIKVIDRIAQAKMRTPGELPSALRSSSLSKTVVLPSLFSDSILLVSNDGSFDSMRNLLMKTSDVIWKAACHGIPIKGAIAYGKQTAEFERSLHVGEPLIDAYELQNDLQMYGVVLHCSAQRRFVDEKWIARLERPRLHEYPTPLRSGLLNHYVLDCWHLDPKESDMRPFLNGFLQDFYRSVSEPARHYVDNTSDFCSWLKDEYERLGKGTPRSG